ncbi:MAG: DNA internalization-related competence protein ComEC/Rec2 [Polyangiales bacterium]
MLDGLLLAAALALAGSLAVVAPLPVAIVVVVAGLSVPRVAAHRPRAGPLIVAVIVAIVAAVRVHSRFVAEEAAASRATSIGPPRRCVLEGTVVSMPRVRGVLAADVEIATLECEGTKYPFFGLRARLYDLPEGVARDDRIESIVQIARARRLHDPDLGDPRPMWARRGHDLSGSALATTIVARGTGVRASIDRLRARFRRGLVRSMPETAAPIGRALVLGEEDLAPDDDDAFRRSGLTHLLAVSGSHVALAVGGLVGAIRWVLLAIPRVARRIESGRVAAAIGIPLALVYEQLAGDSGSARRATAMAVVVLIVRAAGRRPDTARTLGASILAAVVIDPLAAFDVSFGLSLAATLGLVGLGGPLRVLVARVRALPKSIGVAIATTLAASAACAPLVAGLSGSIPISGLFANVVAVPIGELAALPLCNVAAIFGALAEPFAFVAPLARLTGSAAAGAIVLLRRVATIASAPTWAVMTVPPPTAMQLAVLAAAVIAIHLRRTAMVVVLPLAAASLLLLELAQIRRGAPHGVLRVTVLDIGQGDASIVDLPDGRMLLVDGGGEVGSPWDPGKTVIAPTLDMRRRRRVDIAILSHPHPDHFLGMRHPLATRAVGALWDTGQGEGVPGELAGLYASLRARGVTIARPDSLCGTHAIGGAIVEVLHPCPAFDPDRGANDNSLVVRIGFGTRHVLLVGDSEHEAEASLLALHRDLHADLLKVGHHGSRTSSSAAFLAAVSPSIATVSCGVRNRFGHPHRVALDRLESAGIRVLRTDLWGAIRFTTDGASVAVETAREGW